MWRLVSQSHMEWQSEVHWSLETMHRLLHAWRSCEIISICNMSSTSSFETTDYVWWNFELHVRRILITHGSDSAFVSYMWNTDAIHVKLMCSMCTTHVPHVYQPCDLWIKHEYSRSETSLICLWNGWQLPIVLMHFMQSWTMTCMIALKIISANMISVGAPDAAQYCMLLIICRGDMEHVQSSTVSCSVWNNMRSVSKTHMEHLHNMHGMSQLYMHNGLIPPAF